MSCRIPYPILADDILQERMDAFFFWPKAVEQSFLQIFWPDGLTCRRCRGTEFTHLPKRKLYECRRCKHQQTLTAGTALHRTHADLRIWANILYRHLHFGDFYDYALQNGISDSCIRRWERKLDEPDELTEKLLAGFVRVLYRRR